MDDLDWIEDIINTSTIYDCRGESLIAILNNHFKAGGYTYIVYDRYGDNTYSIWDVRNDERFFFDRPTKDFTMKMIIDEIDDVLKYPNVYNKQIIKEFDDLYKCISELL